MLAAFQPAAEAKLLSPSNSVRIVQAVVVQGSSYAFLQGIAVWSLGPGDSAGSGATAAPCAGRALGRQAAAAFWIQGN